MEVAKTISGGLVDEALITPTVVFAGLVGAILWNLVTWMFGLPSSSSHALIGGLVGAAVVGGGLAAVQGEVLLGKVVLPAVVSPVLAGLVALAATRSAYRITARAEAATVRHGFRLGQVAPASTVALAHGANDAQKTMGVITLALIAAGALAPGSGPPSWVVLAAGLAIALGTYVGGWRIIRTLGRRVSDIQTTQGFTAETTAASVILASTHLGIPLSTTHICTGAVFGAAAGRRRATVHWSMAGRIAVAWALTVPAAALVGGAASWVAAEGNAGVLVVAGGAIVAGGGIWAAARRHPVTAATVNDFPEPDQPVRVAA